MPTPLINIIGVKARPEQEAKFNNWYNNVHIPMLMQYEGMKGAERYGALDVTLDYPNLIAFYKYDNPRDLEKQPNEPFYAAVAADIKATWPEGRDIRWRATYFEHRRWPEMNPKPLSPDTVVRIVGVNGPSPEKDAEFNTWYDYLHIPMLMKTGTLTQTIRYRIALPNKEYPNYLAMYYFENQKKFEAYLEHAERLAAVKEMNEHWPSGIGSMWGMQYKLIKEWRK